MFAIVCPSLFAYQQAFEGKVSCSATPRKLSCVCCCMQPCLHAIACVVSVHAMQESNDAGSLRCLEVRRIDTELQLQHTFVLFVKSFQNCIITHVFLKFVTNMLRRVAQQELLIG